MNRILKKAAIVSAVALVGASTYVASNFYNATKPEDVKEAVPVRASSGPAPTSYDNMSWEEAVKSVNKPEEVNDYYGWLVTKYFGNIDRWHQQTSSFKRVHEGKAPYDCTEFALCAAALLSDNGYPPYLLGMQKGIDGHTCFLYKKDGKFRIINKEKGFGSIEDIVHSLGYSNFIIIDLNQQSKKDWMTGKENYFSSIIPGIQILARAYTRNLL